MAHCRERETAVFYDGGIHFYEGFFFTVGRIRPQLLGRTLQRTYLRSLCAECMFPGANYTHHSYIQGRVYFIRHGGVWYSTAIAVRTLCNMFTLIEDFAVSLICSKI